MATWRLLAGIIVLLALIVVGIALATNFRGVTEWHARRSITITRVTRRVPPWRWLPAPGYDEYLARLMLLERVLGVLFAAVGVVFLLALGFGILSGDSSR